MYDIIKLTIQSGEFKLSELQHRVKKLYAMGELSDTQLDELFALLAEKANPEMERPELLDMVRSLSARVSQLDARLKILESGDTTGGDVVDAEEYLTWEPWDGLSDQYQYGAIVDHNGQLWQSTFLGQNVWEPGTVDDRFWVKYTPEE